MINSSSPYPNVGSMVGVAALTPADHDSVAVSLIESEDIDAVSSLTFPAFRSLLVHCQSGEVHGGFVSIAYVARHCGLPVGLVLAQVPANNVGGCVDPDGRGVAKLLSVFVMPAWRQRGVAFRLMYAIEHDFRERDCLGVTAAYTTLMPAWQAFERLLAAVGWSSPEAALLMSKGYCREVIKAPWLSAMPSLSAEFELFHWTELSVDERIQLQCDVDKGLVPSALSPFEEVEDIEPSISVGVRYQGEVVAWMIVTRSPLVLNALCYRSTFVRPQLRVAQGLGPVILAQALRSHAASSIADTRPLGVYGMSYASSPKMINFFRKRLAPYCFSNYESRTSVKALRVTPGLPVALG